MTEIRNLEDVGKFFGACGTFFLATEDGDQPKVRPLSFQMYEDGKLYFVTGRMKDVFHQMEKNPKVEICGFKGADIIRIYGRSVVVDDDALFERCAEVLPLLKQIYNEQTGYKAAVFYIEDPKAEYMNLADYTLKHPIAL